MSDNSKPEKDISSFFESRQKKKSQQQKQTQKQTKQQTGAEEIKKQVIGIDLINFIGGTNYRQKRRSC